MHSIGIKTWKQFIKAIATVAFLVSMALVDIYLNLPSNNIFLTILYVTAACIVVICTYAFFMNSIDRIFLKFGWGKSASDYVFCEHCCYKNRESDLLCDHPLNMSQQVTNTPLKRVFGEKTYKYGIDVLNAENDCKFFKKKNKLSVF